MYQVYNIYKYRVVVVPFALQLFSDLKSSGRCQHRYLYCCARYTGAVVMPLLIHESLHADVTCKYCGHLFIQ